MKIVRERPDSKSSLYAPLLDRTEADVRGDALLETARELANTLAEHRRENDEKAWVPTEQIDLLREGGMFRLTIPVHLGGHGLWQGQAFLPQFRILEALAYGDPSVSQLVQVHSGASYLMTTLGTPEQVERFAHDIIVEGKTIASVGSEAPLAAKGPATYQSTLKRVEGGWILDGIRSFSTFGPQADYFMVWTLMPGDEPASDRMTLVVVPRLSETVELINDWDTLGMRATMSWSIRFKEHFVPDEMVLGRPGWWKRDAPRVSYLLGPSSNYLGIAQRALDFTTAYVGERPHLGGTQIVRIRLGELFSQLQAARLAVYSAARMWEDESISPDAAEFNTMVAMHLARTAAMDVTVRCFDLCGARSTYQIYPLGTALRDARTYTLQHRDDTYMELVGQTTLGAPFSKHAEVDVAIKQG